MQGVDQPYWGSLSAHLLPVTTSLRTSQLPVSMLALTGLKPCISLSVLKCCCRRLPEASLGCRVTERPQ